MKPITFTSDTFDFTADAQEAAALAHSGRDVSIMKTSDGYIYVVYGDEIIEKPVKSRASKALPAKKTTAKDIKESKPAKTGSCKMVWDIADKAKAAGTVDRKTIIAECVQQGINAATASTQYQKWVKNNG